MINAIIFSDDSPGRLRILLQSIKQHANREFNLNVIYHAVDPASKLLYEEKLMPEFSDMKINFVKWECLKDNISNLLKSNSKIVCFLREDNVFYRTRDFSIINSVFENEKDVLSFALRLGTNTTCSRKFFNKNKIRDEKILFDKKSIKWNWKESEFDYSSYYSVEGNIFRTEDIELVLKKHDFKSVDEFEEKIEIEFSKSNKKFMSSFTNNVLVRDVLGPNKAEIKNLYLNNNTIDFSDMYFEYVDGCWMDVPKPNKGFVSTEAIDVFISEESISRTAIAPAPKISQVSINKMNDDLIRDELNKNKIDYKKIKDDSHTVLYNTDIYYDINFIVPVRGRINFANSMYKSFLRAKNNTDLKIAYTVVEFSDIPEHPKFCKDNKINYVWIKSEPGELFNKCLALNIGAMFTVKAKHFLFHDIDCLVQGDFFQKLLQNIHNKNCKAIQCFHGRRVLYLNQELTDSLIKGAIDVNDYKLGDVGIHLPNVIGAPGGSIFVEKDLFFEVGGYDPELFKANAPEDVFFWMKIDLLNKMETSDNPEIDIFHMNHPPTYNSNPQLQHMMDIYLAFKASTETKQREIVELKKKKLEEFYYE